jgi:hypothetical protein
MFHYLSPSRSKKHNDAQKRLSDEADELRTQLRDLQTASDKKLQAEIANMNTLQVTALAEQTEVTFFLILSLHPPSHFFIVVLAVPRNAHLYFFFGLP